jgi:HK97 family phage major capsid protein
VALDTQNSSELTQEQVRSMLIQPLEARSAFLAAGPQIYDVSSPLRIPKAPQPTPGQLQWHGENEKITEHTAEFDEVRLLPSTMKSVKTLTRFSNELARQSVVQLDAALRSRLVGDVAAKLDAHLLSDQGDGVETPQGLFAYEGTQSLDVSGALDLDAIIDAQGMALSANVNVEALRLLVRPDQFTAMRKLQDNEGRYLLQPDAQQAGIGSIQGMRVIVSSRIPAARAALVDFSQIAVARDVGSSVKVLTETFADYDQQAIRVVSRYDAKPLQPDAVITLDNLM